MKDGHNVVGTGEYNLIWDGENRLLAVDDNGKKTMLRSMILTMKWTTIIMQMEKASAATTEPRRRKWHKQTHTVTNSFKAPKAMRTNNFSIILAIFGQLDPE